jgi:threonine dehydratase
MTPSAASPDAAALLASLHEAARGLEGVAFRTPLVPVPQGGVAAGQDLRIKAECCQRIGAFKIRGAYTALRRLDPAVRSRGVVAFSSGNHAQGVACAAKLFGIQAAIVMPANTSQLKVAGVRAHGGEVVFAGERRSPEQSATAHRLAAERGAALIPPYDHPDVIEGQATCPLEILEDFPEVRMLLVPVSGGGLLAGTCAAVLAMGRTDVEVIAVEPAGAAKVSAAFAAGHPVSIGAAATIADGLLTPQVGALTWPWIQRVVRQVVTVTDDEICAAMRFLFDTAGLRLEPSGATAFAAIFSGRLRMTGPTAVIASGGNIDAAHFAELTA